MNSRHGSLTRTNQDFHLSVGSFIEAWVLNWLWDFAVSPAIHQLALCIYHALPLPVLWHAFEMVRFSEHLAFQFQCYLFQLGLEKTTESVNERKGEFSKPITWWHCKDSERCHLSRYLVQLALYCMCIQLGFVYGSEYIGLQEKLKLAIALFTYMKCSQVYNLTYAWPVQINVSEYYFHFDKELVCLKETAYKKT